MKHLPSALVILAAAVPPLACSSGEGTEPEATAAGREAAAADPELEDDLKREVAAAQFSEERFTQAWDTLQPLIERTAPEPEDLLRGAIVKLALNDLDGAAALLERVREPLSDSPALHYNLARVAFLMGDFEQALEHYGRAHELAPADYATELAYANMLAELDRDGEAEQHYRALLARGIEQAGAWHLTTLYRTSTLLVRLGRMDESRALTAEKTSLEARGHKVPESVEIERGNFGRLLPPEPFGTQVRPPAELGAVLASDSRDDVFQGEELAGFEVVDLGDEWPGAAEWDRAGATGIAAWGPKGLRVASARKEGGAWAFLYDVTKEPVERVEPLDLENDGDLDFLVTAGGKLELLVWEDGAWRPADLELPTLPGAVRDVVAVDYDHEGDLDLALVGDFGFRLLRNDGAGVKPEELAPRAPDAPVEPAPTPTPGRFTDVTAETGIPAATPYAWIVTEDFDTDQDVDLLLGGEAGVFLADSLRGGKFADESAGLPAELASSAPPRVADLDGDSRPDLVVPGPTMRVYRSTGDRSYAAADSWSPASPPLAGSLRLVDLDLDGAADLVWSEAGGAAAVRLAAGQPVATGGRLAGSGWPSAGPVDFGDLDGDARAEALARADGLATFELPRPTGGGMKLVLVGGKDNRRGVGAIVEVRAGPIYRRLYWRGRGEVIGFGGRHEAEVVRITWPNGVVQDLVGIPDGTNLVLEQKKGNPGSCPFLYTWNGETYEFVSDVLGITPLGLPMTRDMLVPPDHDEYVLVRGDQLAPRQLEDGSRVYEVQLTEELREVTYLDRVRLDVVDHPAGTEIYPDERFTFPPFPAPHTHTVREPLAPLRATGSDGEDWTGALAAIDNDLARPFREYRDQFQGLADPHWLELAFDPEAVAGAPKLRLLCTGWLFWTDASVNVAASAVDGVDFVPPTLSVPDGAGGWRVTGPPVGFPAGKTKTMVIDVTDALDPADPRVRVSSTLCLYWDSIRLAVDADDSPLAVTSIEPRSADLWERGFSEPIYHHGEQCALEWFDWGHTSPEPRWNQHPGMYTRYGETLPLVTAIDDRFVILGSGDALTVRFDADAAPPLAEGLVRDYLLFLDGWAKDRDPNSFEALYVEPLPFHGMSGYPYGPDESFPDTEEHRRWRAEWNTRPGKRWIAPLAKEPTPPILRSTAPPAQEGVASVRIAEPTPVRAGEVRAAER